jgi:hypothetical protein
MQTSKQKWSRTVARWNSDLNVHECSWDLSLLERRSVHKSTKSRTVDLVVSLTAWCSKAIKETTSSILSHDKGLAKAINPTIGADGGVHGFRWTPATFKVNELSEHLWGSDCKTRNARKISDCFLNLDLRFQRLYTREILDLRTSLVGFEH